MCNITASKDADGRTGLYPVNATRVLFLKAGNGGVIIHTADEQYFAPGSLKYWTTALNASGLHFILCDRNISINMRNIVEIDKVQKLAYFDASDKSKVATMSTTGFREVRNAILSTNIAVTMA